MIIWQQKNKKRTSKYYELKEMLKFAVDADWFNLQTSVYQIIISYYHW